MKDQDDYNNTKKRNGNERENIERKLEEKIGSIDWNRNVSFIPAQNLESN